jgi:hypothetical protein
MEHTRSVGSVTWLAKNCIDVRDQLLPAYLGMSLVIFSKTTAAPFGSSAVTLPSCKERVH